MLASASSMQLESEVDRFGNPRFYQGRKDASTDRQFAALQRFRQQSEGTADEEWTRFKRRS
jgi:hypothetical protein